MNTIELALFAIVTAFSIAILCALLFHNRTGYNRKAKYHRKGTLRTTSGKEYHYEVGDNLSSGGYYFAGVQITMPFALPTLVIDGHKDDRTSAAAPWLRPGESYRMELEGDFYESFAIYTLPEYRSFIPYFLPPNVMELLRDHAAKFDVDILGRQISIIVPKDTFKTEGNDTAILAFATEFISKLESYLRRWHTDHGNQIEPKAMKGVYYSFKRGRKVQGLNPATIGLVIIGIIILSMAGRY